MRLPATCQLFKYLGLVQLLSGLRSLFSASKDDGISLILELLTLRACPAGISLLLRLAASGSFASSGASFALASSDAQGPLLLPAGLATSAAGALWAGNCARRVSTDFSAPTLRASQPPLAVHLASLSICASDAVFAHRRRANGGGGGAPTPNLASAPPSPASLLEEAKLAFCIDIDGTLCLTDDLYFQTFQRLLKPYGYDVDEAFYKEHVHGKVDADVFKRLMEDSTPAQLAALSAEKDALFCELYREYAAANGPPALPGLAQALATAKALGVQCIAVTNAPRGAAEACISSLRAAIPAAEAVLSDTIIVGAECKRAKPHAEPYLEGMRALGVAPQQCVVFEDSSSGVQAGRAAGVRAVVGMRSSMSAEELRALGAYATLDDWTGLTREFLEGLVVSTQPATASAPAASAPAAGPMALRRQRVRQAARRVRTAPSVLLLLMGAAVSAAPAAFAEASLLCKGADAELTATAARAFGAGLLPLATVALSLGSDGGESPAAAAGMPQSAQRILAGSLAATVAVQVLALRQDGHALAPWMRQLLLPPLALVGVTAGA